VKIIRGFKRRQYEFYRVAGFHIEHMATMLKTDASYNAFKQSRISPAYDELDLTPEQRRKLDKYRKLKQIRDRDAMFKRKK
jgi:hypothetical protein